MKRIRIGIIGCGGITQMAHLPHLVDLDELFEVTALCDFDPQILEAVGRHYRIDALYTDYRDLIRSDLDAILIASWGSHYAPIMAALKAGRHVFTEKPMCFSPQEAAVIDEAVKASGLRLMVGYMKRYDPGYQYARKLVQSLTDMRYIQINVLQPVDAMYREHYRLRRAPGEIQTGPVSVPQPGSDEALFLRLASEGEDGEAITNALGKATPQKRVAYWFMLNSLIHDMNALRGIMGNPIDVISTEVWHAGLCMTSVLRFEPDVRCVMSWIYLPAQKNYVEEHAFFDSNTRIRIQFPSPYLLHVPTPVVIQKGEEGGRLLNQKVIISYEESFQLELLHFHDCVVNHKEPLTGSTDALADIKWLQAMALKVP